MRSTRKFYFCSDSLSLLQSPTYSNFFTGFSPTAMLNIYSAVPYYLADLKVEYLFGIIHIFFPPTFMLNNIKYNVISRLYVSFNSCQIHYKFLLKIWNIYCSNKIIASKHLQATKKKTTKEFCFYYVRNKWRPNKCLSWFQIWKSGIFRANS